MDLGKAATVSEASTGTFTTDPSIAFCFPFGRFKIFMKGILCAINLLSSSVNPDSSPGIGDKSILFALHTGGNLFAFKCLSQVKHILLLMLLEMHRYTRSLESFDSNSCLTAFTLC